MKFFFKILFCTSLFFSIQAHALEAVRTRILMGDVPVTIKIKTSRLQKEKAYQAMESAYQRAIEIEQAVSEYQDHSETSRLNRHAGKGWQRIGPDLYELLVVAHEMSMKTNGIFDITFASKKKGVSYQNVQVRLLKVPSQNHGRPNEKMYAQLSNSHVKIGVSGIAKGYILDQMTVVLKQAGFESFIVNAGGDLYAAGKWKVGIRHLNERKMTVKNKAVTSSGLAERGQHLIDPRSQQAALRPYYSVTGISNKATTGNALTLACFVAGPDFCNKSFETKNEVVLIYGQKK